MQSGSATLGQIEDALRDAKTHEQTLQRELEQSNKERATLVATRLDALKALASIRARDAMSDGVIDDADNLSSQVRAILDARLRSIAQLEERQAKAETAREDVVKRHDAQTARINVLEDKLDHFGAAAREALVADPAHMALRLAHENLSGMLEKAAAKAEQVARDEHDKGLPYRGDPLFMYLWQRQLGTSSYQATGVVRMLDEWVARLVRYQDTRANYAMLTEIPVRLRAHAEDLRRQTAAAKANLDDMEAVRTRALAGTDLVAEIRAERDRQAELARELEGLTSELAETGTQLKVYAKGEDQSFQTAVTTYATFLERENLRRLMADASATATAEDDRVVEDVRRLGRELETLEGANATRRRRLDQISERKLELARLASNFRRQRYDDAGSEFADNPRIEDLLQLLLRGAITAADYWARMQQQQSWRHRPGDPWRRQSGLPPFDGFPGGWGGGTGGGSWGGSGSSGSGSSGSSGSTGKDFETGGTF